MRYIRTARKGEEPKATYIRTFSELDDQKVQYIRSFLTSACEKNKRHVCLGSYNNALEGSAYQETMAGGTLG